MKILWKWFYDLLGVIYACDINTECGCTDSNMQHLRHRVHYNIVLLHHKAFAIWHKKTHWYVSCILWLLWIYLLWILWFSAVAMYEITLQHWVTSYVCSCSISHKLLIHKVWIAYSGLSWDFILSIQSIVCLLDISFASKRYVDFVFCAKYNVICLTIV